MKKNISITKIIRENYAWFIAIITILGVIILNILRFIEYLTAVFYFKYYEIDIRLYKFFDQGFLYSLCESIIFLFAFFIVIYCFKQIIDNIKNKKHLCKQNIYNLILIIFLNLYLVFSNNIEHSTTSLIISFIIYIIAEIVMSYFIFNSDTEINKNFSFKEELINVLKTFPFVIILFISCIAFNTYINLELKNKYRIINDNKAIVYSNNDYYITLDCEIDNNKLIIYKGNQEKINNINVYSKLEKFEKVELK